MAYRFKHGDRPLDDYTIQRAVGSGGFGEVYYSVSDGGREVALKYLRQNPDAELRGVSHCINLKSPHLVSIFDVKKNVDNDYFIIMEYCSGPSLRDLLIAEPDGFAPEKAAFFVREIGKGLSYLHERGIVHRDLKPGNLFYDDGYVKIGDYGLSKFISVSRHSAQTASVGTVHYMAPEIGSGDYSRSVDIYALGVILYEMLLGKVPFDGSTMAEILMKHLTTQPELDELPEPFGRVIRRALEKDPKDRYQTVDEMVEDILAVDDVRQSLAGFSPKSLQDAVGIGLAGGADSPMPSPNPAPRPANAYGFSQAYDGPYRAVAGMDAMAPRVARKLNRLSKKMEKKMGRLGGVAHGAAATRVQRCAPPWRRKPAATDTPSRARRILPTLLLSAGIVVGLGLLFGINYDRHVEIGVSASLLTLCMTVGHGLSRMAGNWFGGRSGPGWSRMVVRICICGPMLCLGAAPLLDHSRLYELGGALILGLLVVVAFGNWDLASKRGARGEMNLGHAIWMGFGAGIVSAIAGSAIGVSGRYHGLPFLMGGAVACATLLIVQAFSWAFAPKAPAPESVDAAEQKPGDRARRVGWSWRHGGHVNAPKNNQAVDASNEGSPPFAQPVEHLEGPQGSSGATKVTADGSLRPQRWWVTRAFWSLASFAFMAGTTVLFVLALLHDGRELSERTAAICGCVACGTLMIFSLRKTTMFKRESFWRETMRPFLLVLCATAIGGTITGIAREWDSGISSWAQVVMLSGLVISSIMFITFGLMTGKKRQSRSIDQNIHIDAKPFVITDADDGTERKASS